MHTQTQGRGLLFTAALLGTLFASHAAGAAPAPIAVRAARTVPAAAPQRDAQMTLASTAVTATSACSAKGVLATATTSWRFGGRTTASADADPFCVAMASLMAGALYTVSQINESIRLNNLALEACYQANGDCTGLQLQAEVLQESLEYWEQVFFEAYFAAASYGCFDWY